MVGTGGSVSAEPTSSSRSLPRPPKCATILPQKSTSFCQCFYNRLKKWRQTRILEYLASSPLQFKDTCRLRATTHAIFSSSPNKQNKKIVRVQGRCGHKPTVPVHSSLSYLPSNTWSMRGSRSPTSLSYPFLRIPQQ